MEKTTRLENFGVADCLRSTDAAENSSILFLGQKTLDIYPLNTEYSSDGRSITLRNSRTQKTITIRDGPVTPGNDKYTTDDVLDLQEFSTIEIWGGGVYNSLEGYLKINGHDGRGVYLFDMSPSDIVKGEIVADNLYQMGVGCSFYDYRPTPKNLVLIPHGRVGKLIIRTGGGPRLPRRGLQEDHESNIREKARESRAIFLNSLKDQYLAEIIMQEARKNPGIRDIYALLTTSLPWDFVRDNVLKYVTPIFNYDELSLLLEGEVIGDENTKIDYAIDRIKRIRRDNLNEKHCIHVTLGKNGVLVADTEKIYHIKLKDGKSEEVNRKVKERNEEGLRLYRDGEINQQEFIDGYLRGVTGAGDNYAASEFHSKVVAVGKSLTSRAIDACKHAIEYIGYDGVLSSPDFELKCVGDCYQSRRLYNRGYSCKYFSASDVFVPQKNGLVPAGVF